MRFMVIEHFNDARAVYARARERGRMLPDGVRYLDSWVTQDLGRCFQLLEAERREDLDPWIAKWSDLVEFEVVPVVASAEAARRALEV